MPKIYKLIIRILDQNQWNQDAQIKNSLTAFFENPPEGVGETLKAPEVENRQRFDFSIFFKLETYKNLYKIFLVKLIAMIDLIFWLELHYKKATFDFLYI